MLASEARDYIDVHAALASGEYTEDDLLRLAQRADAGFDQCTFAHALLGVDRARDADFAVYGVASHDIAACGSGCGAGDRCSTAIGERR